ncbi:MAG: hypothetical protein J1F35_05025 [Erysipelotrichales bacterium]|nr:hypothetical protein [Erysipelotrichales bacterium]
MKDYSFGDKEYRKTFIKKYRVSNDKTQYIIYYADGSIRHVDRTPESRQQITEIMKQQIEAAYSRISNRDSVSHYQGEDILAYLVEVLAIKLKEKDIIKNKLFADNLDFINELIRNRDLAWTNNLSLWLQDQIIWPWNKRENGYEFTLSSADMFSLGDVKELVMCAQQQGKKSN